MINLNEVMDTINKLKMTKASLSGRQEQLETQLKNTLMPEFEKLGVTPDTIEQTIKVEEEDMQKSYQQIFDIVSSVNVNIKI